MVYGDSKIKELQKFESQQNKSYFTEKSLKAFHTNYNGLKFNYEYIEHFRIERMFCNNSLGSFISNNIITYNYDLFDGVTMNIGFFTEVDTWNTTKKSSQYENRFGLGFLL